MLRHVFLQETARSNNSHGMEISCIIPVHNRKGLVKKAIRSVIEQGCSHSIEIIVVDDCSSDGTPELIHSLYPEIKLVKTGKNLGPGGARNMGAANARGKVLMFLDSDDTWLPLHARLLMDGIRNGAEVSYGITESVDSESGSSFFIPEKDQYHSGMCHGKLKEWCFLVPSSVAVTASAFRQAGGFAQWEFGEDWHFFLTLSKHFEFHFVPQTITRRLLHRGSLCASGNIQEKICHMLKRLYHHAAEKNDREGAGRFSALAAHSASKGEQWKTVQDWYMSLKRHGLL